jgi:hypothetical protein
MREPILRIFGTIFQRTVTPTHLTILTNQELILIHERDWEVAGPQYGGVWQYIPLRSITSISLAEAANDRIMLSVTLSSSETINKLFVVSSQPKLKSLCTQVQGLIGQYHVAL